MACPDTLVTGCITSLTEDTDDDNDTELDTTDVDDDNDGLIEIATASELNNMRHNRAGTSYKSSGSAADNFTGAPNVATGEAAPASVAGHCSTPTPRMIGSSMRDTYLCGYELVADIDLSSADQNGSGAGNEGNFDPIGNQSSEHFTAYLEGNGYTISDLNIDITAAAADANDANDAALIASCRGVVSNLVLADADIHGRRRVAVLCTTMNGGAVRNVQITGSIQGNETSTCVANNATGSLVGQMEGSSSISNSTATGNVSGQNRGLSSCKNYTGGLVGWMLNSSSISNSTATGDVSGRGQVGGLAGFLENASSISNSTATGNASGGGRTGGLVGTMHNSSSISNSTATGNVPAGEHGGGLVGSMHNSSSISNSTATGNVSSNVGINEAGGLVGRMEGSSSISNSYATGDVYANDKVGGLVGEMRGGSINNSTATGNVFISLMASRNNNVGGLVGSMVGSSSISNSTATGNVYGHTNVGGLVGQMEGSVSNSYYNSEATQALSGTDRASDALRGVGTDTSDPSGVSAKTLSQIQSLTASTLGWDDTNHWAQVGMAGKFPLLRYGDNPNTGGVDECEFLPGYGNTDTNKVRCGDLLPLQELYRAGGNVVLSNATFTSSGDYNVDATSVTVTYDLATGVTLSSLWCGAGKMAI